MLWERVLLLSSVSASQNFHRMLHFLLLLCRKVVGGRKTASKMSAKRLYEQARATLRTKQRGTDGRVKEHKRQRKQIHTHTLSLSLSVRLSLSLFLSFSLYASVTIFFLFGLISFLMTNTLILHVSCVYFLSSCSLLCVSSYGLGTDIGHPTALRSHVDCNQLHSRKMPASSDSTHDCLFAARIVGRVTYSLPLGRSISPPLLYKIRKEKKNLCSKTITSDLIDFLP